MKEESRKCQQRETFRRLICVFFLNVKFVYNFQENIVRIVCVLAKVLQQITIAVSQVGRYKIGISYNVNIARLRSITLDARRSALFFHSIRTSQKTQSHSHINTFCGE